MATFGEKLDSAIRAVCPHITGISVGRREDRATWRITFKDEASDSERAAAHAVMMAHADVTDDPEPEALDQLKDLLQRNPDLLRKLVG